MRKYKHHSFNEKNWPSLRKLILFLVMTFSSHLSYSSDHAFTLIEMKEDLCGYKVRKITTEEKTIWQVHDPFFDPTDEFNSLCVYTNHLYNNSLVIREIKSSCIKQYCETELRFNRNDSRLAAFKAFFKCSLTDNPTSFSIWLTSHYHSQNVFANILSKHFGFAVSLVEFKKEVAFMDCMAKLEASRDDVSEKLFNF